MPADYLLSLAALHAAAPGVLDVVFGPDGDFDGAPRWTCPLRAGVADPPLWVPAPTRLSDLPPDIWRRCSLDLRIPSVSARLLRLCSFVETVDPNLEPADIASLTLALAPRIAALGGYHV